MTQTASANGWNGINLPEDNLPKVYGNNGTNITTITTTYWGKSISNPFVQVGGVVYVKTLTYAALGSGTIITNESQWIPQA